MKQGCNLKYLAGLFICSKFLKMDLEFNRVHLPVFIDFRLCELLKEWMDLTVAGPFDAQRFTGLCRRYILSICNAH